MAALARADKSARPWQPAYDLEDLGRPTPQRRAYDSAADELLYGGAAGGGKTDLLIGLALSAHRRSIIFRREFKQVAAIEDRVAEILGHRRGYNGQKMVWRLGQGRQIEFGACQHPGDERGYQGRPHDLKAFDELTHFTEGQYRFLSGWLRTTVAGQRCRIVAATNPPTTGEGEWVIARWAPWLDDQNRQMALPGELRWYAVLPGGEEIEVEDGRTLERGGERIRPKSRTFIPSAVDDNPYLANTAYKATLQALPEPLRSQMLKGDWRAGGEDHPWQIIPSAWVRAAQERWRNCGRPGGAMDAIGVDVAQGGQDETVLTMRHGEWVGEQIVAPGRQTRDGPAVVALIAMHVRDSAQINIDCTGGWGGSAYDILSQQGAPVLRLVMSARSEQRDLSGSLGFANKRAELYWRAREWFDPENGHEPAIPPDPRLRGDLCTPRWMVKRGQAGEGGVIQVEDKKEIIARLGHSPDRGDSLIYALDDTRPRQWLRERSKGRGPHEAVMMASPWG
jgi:hypothetical protein